MKNKIFFLVTALVLVTGSISAQHMADKDTFMLNDTTKVVVGQELLVNIPFNNSFDFLNIKKAKGFSLGKISKIADVGGALGSTLGTVGMATGNIGTLGTAIDIMNTANVASSIGMTAEAIDALNVSPDAKDIISKKLKVIKIDKKGSDKKGYAYTAVVVVSGTDKKYQVDLEPALRTKEVLILSK